MSILEIGDRLGWSLLTWFGAIAGGVVTGAIGVLVAGRYHNNPILPDVPPTRQVGRFEAVEISL